MGNEPHPGALMRFAVAYRFPFAQRPICSAPGKPAPQVHGVVQKTDELDVAIRIKPIDLEVTTGLA